jgi:hypothetical protein
VFATAPLAPTSARLARNAVSSIGRDAVEIMLFGSEPFTLPAARRFGSIFWLGLILVGLLVDPLSNHGTCKTTLRRRVANHR